MTRFYKNSLKETEEIVEEAEEPDIEMPATDTSDWKTYRSNWYGFEVKYPDDWNAPVVKKAAKDDKWEYRYLFRKKEITEEDEYAGFDVAVYDVKKVSKVLDSEEFPSLKNPELTLDSSCQTIEDHLAMNENFPAEEINISPDDQCFEPALFYAFAFNRYAYNISPASKNEDKKQNSKEEILSDFPEFFSVAAGFNLVEIKRTAKTRAAVIIGPKPTAKTKIGPGGKRVCAKKNDHPGKSKENNKGKKHMDMECCLDPDEYPNPHCYYSESKYGKYLK